MTTDTAQRILAFIEKNERVSPKVIIEYMGLSPVAVFRQLHKMLQTGEIEKQGKAPKVFYRLALKSEPASNVVLTRASQQIIEERFFKILPDGSSQQGIKAFTVWCRQRGLDVHKTSDEYLQTWHKYDVYKQDGLIDGMQKLRKTFPVVYFDKLYYLDFYSIERFGKTKLGEQMLYAKQSQNRGLIQVMVPNIRSQIERLIHTVSIDAVGFVPPTIRRDIQFMRELERLLALTIPHLKITKIKTQIVVPQKTLSKLEERTENAKQSIVLEDDRVFQNILLIDDAVGSGATLQEVARQIRQKNLCRGNLIGLGLTGSFNGFDVLQEA